MHFLRKAVSGSCHLREGVLTAKPFQAFATSMFADKYPVFNGLGKVTEPKPEPL
jgi:hypothetical protein